MKAKIIGLALLIGVTAAQSSAAVAQELTTLQDATREAVLNNPGVLNAFHSYQAASNETRVAWGRYLPRVDLEGAYGKEYRDGRQIVNQFGDDYDFTRDRVSLALTQMLFDGFETRNDVRRLNHAARTRYYEVQQASEQIASEVSRAYFDVLRHRELTSLSEQNYATHRVYYDQIERRTAAGVSRRVDLEQAAGRLALAESNLLTDTTNLYDVSRRYQRIVGTEPSPNLEEPRLPENRLPGTLNDTLLQAYAESPLMNAAVANVWSAQANADRVKARNLPRFDIRARQDIWHDKDNFDGRYEEGVIELVMTYNLYNGGSDQALRTQRLLESNVAMDVRNETCRNIRQDISISYNNMQRLEEQLIYLDRHQLSIEKAREAYRRQFDIGQRTLLDLLDTENEYYEARRAYTNGRFDHAIAYATTLAGTGQLVDTLSVGETHAIEMPDVYDEETADLSSICPASVDTAADLDKEAIFRKAMENQGLMSAPGNADTEPTIFKIEPDDRNTGAAGPGLDQLLTVGEAVALETAQTLPIAGRASHPLMQLPSDTLMLQLGIAPSEQGALALARSVEAGQSFALHRPLNNAWIALAGPYKTPAEANASLRALPKSITRWGAWVRPTADIQNEVQKLAINASDSPQLIANR